MNKNELMAEITMTLSDVFDSQKKKIDIELVNAMGDAIIKILPAVSDNELRTLIKIIMINDNNPEINKDEMDILINIVDGFSRAKGFANWVDALHKL